MRNGCIEMRGTVVQVDSKGTVAQETVASEMVGEWWFGNGYTENGGTRNYCTG